MDGYTMSVTYNFNISRPTSDAFSTSYDVWVKRGAAPEAVGDGIFVGNYPILASSTTVAVSYTTQLDGVHHFLAIGKRGYMINREVFLQ